MARTLDRARIRGRPERSMRPVLGRDRVIVPCLRHLPTDLGMWYDDRRLAVTTFGWAMVRRTFFKRIAIAVKGLIGGALAVPGLRFLLDPLFRSRKATGFIRVAAVGVIPADRPVRMVVSADRWDAFTHHPPGPLGSVWLVRLTDADGEPDIRCLQSICPHLGCGINFSPDRSTFQCPCHASEFDTAGRRLSGAVSRNMDELETRLTKADARGERWIEVEYREFQTGVAEKLPLV